MRFARASLALILVLAACTDAAPGSTTTSTVPPTSVTVPPTTGGTVPPFVEVEVALSADGRHLVDESGHSLYLFTLDDERTSTCVGPCAAAWPPLLGDPVAGEGVDPALLGNAERGNGSIQVTYGGYPLYRYSGDIEPGDANGHGFNDVWFLVSPAGEPVGPGS